uniref:Lipoma HMGIC fusion partner-like 3 protein n=1 Tax=Macrostomum lignano TaxID=282301 RepID=A0A1I8IH12_9PLAT
MSTTMNSRTVVDKTTESYYISYRRNLLAVGVMWAIFVPLSIVVVVAQPQWIGDTSSSPGVGFFGLIRYCQLYQTGTNLVCDGRLDDFSTILNDAFRAATVMSGLAALLALTTIVLMILFFFVRTPEWVFRICGTVLAVTCLFSLLGCVIYPSGWDHAKVRSVCGSNADKFNPGSCGIRWAFILAILSIFDSLVLAILAFVLGSRFAKLRPIGHRHSRRRPDEWRQAQQAAVENPKILAEVNSAYADDLYHNPATTPRVATLEPANFGDDFTDISFNTAAKSTRSKNFQL